jgi:hypothetical protein
MITTIVIRGISIRFVFINVMQISNVCENFQIYTYPLKWSAGGWWFVWFVDNGDSLVSC